MHRSDEAMIFIGIFNKNLYNSIISVAKPTDLVVFAYTYVSRSPALLYGDFCMNLYFFDTNGALNASSLQFL
jgi:hypothetical protein